MYTDYINTPLGAVEFKASSQGITQVIFCGVDRGEIRTNDITDCCKQQLAEYFIGKRTIFDLPLDPRGTNFQKSVWACLAKIPFGHTLTYRDIANMLNNPKAVRAVGGANGRNPISIILPCHRVIGTNGTLTGYAGGIERKLWLLKHESVDVKYSRGNQDIENVFHTRQAKTQYLK